MPGSKSAYLENALLNHALGAQVWTPPTVIYVALSSALYDEDAYGTAFSELAGNGYGRVAMANNTTNWPQSFGTSQKKNGITITFPAATNVWAEVKSFYLLDAMTAGNALWGGDLANPRILQAGDTASFAPNSIVITED
jgi:hypothetical protein